MTHTCDFLVIGSGLAGLSFALKVADRGRVIILSKMKAQNTNTAWAQGGIAAVMADDDSFEDHINDTLTAGAGLCHPEVVRMVVENAPERIKDLLAWGVKFDLVDQKTGAKIDLTREGGHSHRRILHVQDHTGAEIHARLLHLVQQHPNIEIHEDCLATDLITNKDLHPFTMEPARCVGASVVNVQKKEVHEYFARATMLATGGAGKVYLYTSNWSGATGDGIAMASRAGARVSNLEFMQFHPTCLYHPSARNFLITEAIRGEGGELINGQGDAFMKKHHPLGSLAPRDIVARSIDAEMKRTGADCVYLDITHKPAAFLQDRFPVIYRKCLDLGIDMTKQPIPVVPAAHYLCGGVLTDMNGRTDLLGLFAAGETACTGLHGANRLASNSLLECLVFAHSSAKYVLENPAEFTSPNLQMLERTPQQEQNEDEMIVISHMWDEIRRLMWNYVGIVRSNRRLRRAKKRLENIMHEIQDYYSGAPLHPDIIELRNIALVADLTVDCALKRHESRGIHYNIDYPFHEDANLPAHDTILGPRNF